MKVGGDLEAAICIEPLYWHRLTVSAKIIGSPSMFEGRCSRISPGRYGCTIENERKSKVEGVR
jgi:hypothetical protein